MDTQQLLTRLLSLNHIHYQPPLMAALTPKLTLALGALTEVQSLQDVSSEALLSALQSIPFVRVMRSSSHNSQSCIQLSYPNLERIVFVSGLSNELLQNTLKYFTQSYEKLAAKLNVKDALASITARNDSWLTIECAHHEVTSHLQRFLRIKKKNQQNSRILSGRQTTQKVRIVRGDQDLFTFLVDMVAEQKSRSFFKSISIGHIDPYLRKKTMGSLRQEGIIYQLMCRAEGAPVISYSSVYTKQHQNEQTQQHQHQKDQPTITKAEEYRIQAYMDSTSESSDRNHPGEFLTMQSIPHPNKFVYEAEEQAEGYQIDEGLPSKKTTSKPASLALERSLVS